MISNLIIFVTGIFIGVGILLIAFIIYAIYDAIKHG